MSGSRPSTGCRLLMGVALLALLLALAPRTALAQGPEGRSIALVVPFTRFAMEQGGELRLDVKVVNNGNTPERVNLDVSPVPQGWDVTFESRFPRFPIYGVYVTPGDKQEIKLRLSVPLEAPVGPQHLTLTAQSEDGVVKAQQELVVEVTPPAEPGKRGFHMQARYPVLSGPAGNKFEFLIDLVNKTGENHTFDLIAQVPQGWDYIFKPEFSSKQIASISVEDGQTQGVNVDLTPPTNVKPGEYTIKVAARSGNFADSVELKVEITGTFDMRFTTPSGVLNTKATAGKETSVSLVVINTGTAPLSGISFLAGKPEGWKVEFSPDRIDRLEPQEVREVVAKITPPAKAIAGDYALTLRASHPKVSKDVNLRVTVSTPTIWGWVGAAIVVLVVAGLVGLFVRLGRR